MQSVIARLPLPQPQPRRSSRPKPAPEPKVTYEQVQQARLEAEQKCQNLLCAAPTVSASAWLLMAADAAGAQARFVRIVEAWSKQNRK